MPVRPRARRGARSPERAASSLVISGRGLHRGRIVPLEVGLDDDGWIVAIGRDLRAPRRHDVGESILLPAGTDLHVHFRSPEGNGEAENWATGSRQAALGGIALVGDMPNTTPPVTTPDQLRERASRGRGRLAIDLFQYAAVRSASQVTRAAREAGAFKLYMAPTTGISDSHGEEPLERILAAVAETGLALAVHAEDAALFGDLGGATTLAQWDSVRPIGAEVAAVAELLRVAPPRLRLHVTHATSPEVVERVRAAGQFVDATPHHLLLAADTSADARRKVNPPLRPVPIPSELWTLLQRGTLSAIGSDHAPHSAEAKGKPFSEAPAGMPGVATLVPLLLAKVGRGELPLGRLLDAACDRPARWIGTPHGRLLPGHRGHILVVDFRAIRKFRPEQLPVGCGWSAFEGWDSIFPREHWRNGQRIVQDGEFVGRSDGRVLRPEYAPGAPRSDGSRAAPPG